MNAFPFPRRILIALLLCVVAPTVAAAENALPARTLHGHNIQIALLSNVKSVVPGQPFYLAVRLKPDHGWHSYWRNPGDVGLPTRITWDLPGGGTAGPILWPPPERVPYQNFVNYGYDGSALLLTRITPPGDAVPGSAWPVTAEVNWLICRDICIPGSGKVALTLQVSNTGTAVPSRWASTIEAARRQLPQTLENTKARFHLDDNLIIDLPDTNGRIAAGARLRFFPVDPDLVDNSAAPVFDREAGHIRIKVPRSPDFSGTPPDDFQGLLLAGHGDATRGFYFHSRLDPATIPFQTTPTGTGLLTILLFALAGGLLLNLMPCVFPVLSIKILSLIKSGGHSPRQRRLHGLAYAAGILLSFIIFAVVLLGLRAAGESIGWGFQLQSPWFVGILAYILFGMGLILSGLAEPGTALTRAGGLLQSHGGLAGSFLNGVLATVVATPCTVPFMATAMGAALLQPAPVAVSVFAVLGLGLALPFLIIAFVPALAVRLPRPGHWMQTLKQVLAFPLYLSVVWLLWVLDRQTDADVLAWVLVGMVLIGLALWLWRQAGPARAPLLRLGAGLALIAAIGLLPGIAMPVPPAAGPHGTDASASSGSAYSRSALDQALAAGHPVFVNISADWCITCKVNERLALHSDAVQNAFARNHVVYLVGDWTNGDPKLTRVLRRFNRPGVPLYLVYLPGRDAPEVLPQLLTPERVISAIESGKS